MNQIGRMTQDYFAWTTFETNKKENNDNNEMSNIKKITIPDNLRRLLNNVKS